MPQELLACRSANDLHLDEAMVARKPKNSAELREVVTARDLDELITRMVGILGGRDAARRRVVAHGRLWKSLKISREPSPTLS